jgi:uracil-DNA glycosylase family 4
MASEADYRKLEQIEQEAVGLLTVFPSLSKRYVPGEGGSAEAFIIGPAPDATEDIQRRPFVGKYAVLRQLMDLADLHCSQVNYTDNCWLTNVVKFRPAGSRNPSNAEVKAFRRLLQEEWHAVGSPSLIIPVGSIALSAIFGKLMPILKHAGRVHTMRSDYTGKLLYIWPMLHPAFALTAGSEIQALAEHDWDRLGKWRKKLEH